MSKTSALATELANITNSLKAMEIIAQLKDKTPEPKTIDCIAVHYTDGSSDYFRAVAMCTEIISEEPIPTAPDCMPAKVPATRHGDACIIHGVRYLSVSHAARALGMYRGTVRDYLNDPKKTDWGFINV